LRGSLGSACPQPEPNATELPSCAPISARAAQRRRRRRRWWRGEEGARSPGPEGEVLRHVPWYVLRNAGRRVLHVLAIHVSPKGKCGGGARVRVAARRSIPFCPAYFTFSPFTCRPPLPLGLPDQRRASNVQRAPGATIEKPLMKVPWGAWG